MSTEQLYEKIEAYLDRAMGREELAAFEKELATDQELQRELALHRRLHQELGKAGKARLRKQLQEVAAEFPTEDPPKGGTLGKWLLGMALAALIGVLAWWLVQRAGGQENAPAPTAQQQDSTNLQPAPVDTASLPTAPDAPLQEVDRAASPSKPPQPIADAFSPNARMEALLGAKSGEYAITADAGATQRPDGRYELVIAGLLRTPELPENARFLLRVYDNQALGNKPLEEISLKLDPVEGGEDIYAFGKLKNFTFRSVLKNRLKPGLYYYLIIADGEESPLFAGKATLGRPVE